MPIVLGSITVALGIAMLVGWILIIVQNLSLTREVAQNTWLLVTGIISFTVIISVLVMFIVFLVRAILEVRRQVTFIDSVTHELKSPLASVKLCLETMSRADLNEPFEERARTQAARGTLEADLPTEGMWEFVLSAVDGAGHESVDVSRVKKAEFTVGYDATPPVIVLRGSQLPNGRQTYVNEKWEVEWTADDLFTPAAQLKYRVEYSADGGKTWFPAYPVLFGTNKADLRGHFTQGKPHRVRVIVTDLAGNQAEAVSGDFKLDDIPPAPLSLRGLSDGGQYVAGEKVMISWSSTNRAILKAEIEISRDGGKTWQKSADMHTKAMWLNILRFYQ